MSALLLMDRLVHHDPRLLDRIDIKYGKARWSRAVHVDNGGVYTFGGRATHFLLLLFFIQFFFFFWGMIISVIVELCKEYLALRAEFVWVCLEGGKIVWF